MLDDEKSVADPQKRNKIFVELKVNQIIVCVMFLDVVPIDSIFFFFFKASLSVTRLLLDIVREIPSY